MRKTLRFGFPMSLPALTLAQPTFIESWQPPTPAEGSSQAGVGVSGSSPRAPLGFPGGWWAEAMWTARQRRGQVMTEG